MQAPKIYLEPAWSSRAFSIGLLTGAMFTAFIVVPLMLWLTGAAFCVR